MRFENKANDGVKGAIYTFTPCYCTKYIASDADKPYFKEVTGYCNKFNTATLFATFLGILVSLAILIVNILFRTIMITLICWIGEDTHSQQLKSITNGIFVTIFFNTGLLLPLVFANFEEVGLPLASYFNAQFPDFTPMWYVVVGFQLEKTMIINALFPFIEFTVAYTKGWLARKMDRSWTNDTYQTKLSSMQLYIDLYSGPEYMIHFKYSGILNVCYITMMYGIGQPVLFAIAAMTYFILMSVERCAVAYFYQLPPTFDDKLTKNAMMILRLGAPLYLFFGYWQLSNKQIFHNVQHDIEKLGDVMLTTHTFDNIIVDQAAPLALMGVAVSIIILMQTFFKKALRRWGFSFGGSKINVDENLPFFFTGVKLYDADWLIAENKNLNENFGV